MLIKEELKRWKLLLKYYSSLIMYLSIQNSVKTQFVLTSIIFLFTELPSKWCWSVYPCKCSRTSWSHMFRAEQPWPCWEMVPKGPAHCDGYVRDGGNVWSVYRASVPKRFDCYTDPGYWKLYKTYEIIIRIWQILWKSIHYICLEWQIWVFSPPYSLHFFCFKSVFWEKLILAMYNGSNFWEQMLYYAQIFSVHLNSSSYTVWQYHVTIYVILEFKDKKKSTKITFAGWCIAFSLTTFFFPVIILSCNLHCR